MADDELRALERAHSERPDDIDVAERLIAAKLRASGWPVRRMIEQLIRFERAHEAMATSLFHPGVGTVSREQCMSWGTRVRLAFVQPVTPRDILLWINTIWIAGVA